LQSIKTQIYPEANGKKKSSEKGIKQTAMREGNFSKNEDNKNTN